MTNDFTVHLSVDLGAVKGWRGRFWAVVARAAVWACEACINFCHRRILALVKIRHEASK